MGKEYMNHFYEFFFFFFSSSSSVNVVFLTGEVIRKENSASICFLIPRNLWCWEEISHVHSKPR